MQMREADEKMLSSILARVAALENENKNLRDEANKEKAGGPVSNNMEDVKACILKETSRKWQSSLEQSSSEQESDNMEDTEVCFEYKACLKLVYSNRYVLCFSRMMNIIV